MEKISIIIICLLLSLTVLALDLPEHTGYVNDYAGIFNEQEKQQITSVIEEIEKSSTAEIAVVTVQSLEGTTKEEYAVELFKKWGIGKKDVDNGLLILIAPNDRVYRIEVGYGLEGFITDAIAGRVARKNFVTNFRAEKYGKGVYEAVLDFKGYIEKDPEIISSVEKYKKPQFEKEMLSIFMSLIMFLIFLGMIMRAATSQQKKKKAVKTKIFTGIVLFLILLLIFGLLMAIIAFVLYLIFALPTGKGGHMPPIFFGGGRHGGGFSGGFGGFGGGMSGGGGAGGGW